MEKNKHIIQLDGLRFFAVLFVMIAHWLQWSWSNDFLKNLPFVHGVTLFFVLSGFLITRILLNNKDEAIKIKFSAFKIVKNFYIRRFLRIFPIYFLLIFLLFFVNYKNTRELFPWLVSYTINIYQSIKDVYIGDFNHFWSLAVEEQFYLFWPFLILFVKPPKILAVILITIILAILCKFYFFFFIEKWMATEYFTLNCMSSLGLGALLAYLVLNKQNFVEKLSSPKWLYLLSFLYISSLFFKFTYENIWYKVIVDEIVFSLLSVLIILRASTNGFKWVMKYILESKFVSYSGKISYGLYVYHLFVSSLFLYLTSFFELNFYSQNIVFLILYFMTFIIAHFSWILIEKPISKLKSKVPYI